MTSLVRDRTAGYTLVATLKGAAMTEENYEAPQITVLGDITDMTQVKPGFYFDMPGSAEGNTVKPPPGTPGTGTS